MTEQRRHGEQAETTGRVTADPSSAEEREGAPSEQARRAGAVVAPAGPATAVVVPRQQPGQAVVSRRGILRIGFWSSLGAIIAGAAAGSAERSPLDIAKGRYARGEIGRDEFERMRQDPESS